MNNIKKKLLLVEDEPLIAFSETQILKENGYEVINAYSGEQAIDKVKKGEKIDLILMDIDLGKGMNGTETAKIILKDNEIPVVFLSCHTEAEYVKKTEGISSYGYIIKNFGDAILLSSIKMAFRLYTASKKDKENSITLQDSELRYRRLFESAQDGIFILDADSGKITDINPYLIDMIGYTKGELIGKHLWEISPFKDIAKNKNNFIKLKQNKYIRYEHLPLLAKNNKILNVEFVSNIYHVNNEQVIQCNVRDITRRKILEDKKQKILTEKETLLLELKHRMKNSLTIIAGLIGLEISRVTDKTIKDALNNIKNRINSIAYLYDMLDHSEETKKILLNQYIDQLTASLSRSYITLKEKIKIELLLDEIYIDVKRAIPIGLILNELITNALKHAFTDNKEGLIQVVLKDFHEYVIIEVIDNGIGLPAGFSFENGSKNGLGIMLAHMLSVQIEASLEYIKRNGTLFRLKFSI